ncbi:MAG: cysteine dioxygenase family protein [Planctomycetaceae bacterium]
MNTAIQLIDPTTSLARIARLPAAERTRSRTVNVRFEEICYRLMVKAMTLPSTATAHAFRPILEQAAMIPSSAWRFLAADGSDGRKVLVDNDRLKVVLIRWAPGEACDRHLHPKGGGMFTVLEGAIHEEVFLNDHVMHPYATRVHERSAMSYIDDSLGAHIVANPYTKAAVTLHAYLKYRTVGARSRQ